MCVNDIDIHELPRRSLSDRNDYIARKHAASLSQIDGIFKGDQFYRIPIFGMYCLASYKPPDGGYCFPHMGVEIASLEKIQIFQNSFISVEGMVIKMETRFLSFA